MGQLTQPKGFDLSIYEVNHHITGGDAPADARNRLVTSIGGGLNIINWMLLMLERQEVRVQNFFSLFQLGYNTGVGQVRLWGSVLSMKSGAERYRPTFLALMLANKVLSGDLTEVTRSGDDPDWTCTHRYDDDQDQDQQIPYLHAYATRDGTRRGLILINLHRTDSLPVRLELPQAPTGSQATRYDLVGDTINANNELEHAAEVEVIEEVLSNFGQQVQLSMRPFSMTVLSWQDAG